MSPLALTFANFLYYIAIALGIIVALLIAVGLLVYINVIFRNIHRWISDYRRERGLRGEVVVGCRAGTQEVGGDVEMGMLFEGRGEGEGEGRGVVANGVADAVPRIEVSELGGEEGRKVVAPEKADYSGYL